SVDVVEGLSSYRQMGADGEVSPLHIAGQMLSARAHEDAFLKEQILNVMSPLEKANYTKLAHEYSKKNGMITPLEYALTKDDTVLQRIIGNIELDNAVFVREGMNGKLLDVADSRHLKKGVSDAIEGFQDNVKIPFLNINPFDLLPLQARRAGAAKNQFKTLRFGQEQGFVNMHHPGEESPLFKENVLANQESKITRALNNSEIFYVNGYMMRNRAGEITILDEGLETVPSSYGAYAKTYKNMSGFNELETNDERGFIAKLFDFGRQQNPTRFQEILGAMNKFGDTTYGPNRLKSLYYDERNAKLIDEDAQRIFAKTQEDFNALRTNIDKNTVSLSSEMLESLALQINKDVARFGTSNSASDGIGFKVAGEAFDFTRLNDEQYVFETAYALQAALKDKKSNVRGQLTKTVDGMKNVDPSVTEFESIFSEYLKDPRGFLSSKSVGINTHIETPLDHSFPYVAESQVLITGPERLKKSVESLLIANTDMMADAGSISDSYVLNVVAAKALANGEISTAEFKNLKDRITHNRMSRFVDMNKPEARDAFASKFMGEVFVPVGQERIGLDGKPMGEFGFSVFGNDIQEAIQRAEPKWGKKVEDFIPSPVGSDTLIIRKGSAAQDIKQSLSRINRNIYQSQPNNINDGIFGIDSSVTDYIALLRQNGKYSPIDGHYSTGLLSHPNQLAFSGNITTEDLKHNATEIADALIDRSVGYVQELLAGRGSIFSSKKGADKLTDVTSRTVFAYSMAERLNAPLEAIGMGLSRENMGTMQSVIGNQFMRKFALPYMAAQQLMYFDGLTDDTVSDGAADMYVDAHIGLNRLKELTGINKIMRPWSEVFKQTGGDQIGEWIGIKQLDFLTMGALSDFRSGEDVEYYYEHGEDAVRRNRYWGIGSTTPWAGAGIEYYKPNWYRQLKSDYKFSENMYGSESEYWANHWMPTLTNPLAPIRHFITDPYHYENKHKKDRPYAVTAGFEELDMIPVIGPTVNKIASSILKPQRENGDLDKAHREYLAEANAKLQQTYRTAQQGAVIHVGASGEVTVRPDIYNVSSHEEGSGGGTGTGSGGSGAGGAGNRAGITGIKLDTGEDLLDVTSTSDPFALGIGRKGGAQAAVSSYISQLNYQTASLKQKDIRNISNINASENPFMVQDLKNADDLRSLRNSVVDGFYSASEIGGLYGFLTKSGIGYDEGFRGLVLEDSSRMTSYSRAFWDASLGSAGGGLSEIGRRYVPRDPNSNYFSPIRNTMPEWMPGIGSLTDFQHGDPYAKVKHGEMRLPGESYSKLYKLHPDGTGYGEWAQYGTFDRFRILSDIAPKSAEYKIAKSEVLALKRNGGFT
ncbi:MAG: hypothetical protein ACRC5C_07525, partial [Bacilli bacterium]